MTLTYSYSLGSPTKKYCKGCKCWLTPDNFSLKSAFPPLLTDSCMKCNEKAYRNYYYENLDDLSVQKSRFKIRDKPSKHTFIKLDMRLAPGTVVRKCPHCGYKVIVSSTLRDGICNKTGKTYHVNRGLSSIKLEAEFEKRNYEQDVLDFIKMKGTTWVAEIVAGASISKGKVSQVVTQLDKENKIKVHYYGSKKMVQLN